MITLGRIAPPRGHRSIQLITPFLCSSPPSKQLVHPLSHIFPWDLDKLAYCRTGADQEPVRIDLLPAKRPNLASQVIASTGAISLSFEEGEFNTRADEA